MLITLKTLQQQTFKIDIDGSEAVGILDHIHTLIVVFHRHPKSLILSNSHTGVVDIAA